MHDKKSILLTLVCTIIILGVGYLGIVEEGKEILRSESVPERAEYEDVGSNIFYGKIEDDIEIFPWNYYPENAVKEEMIPNFIMGDEFSEPYLHEKTEEIDRILEEAEPEGITDLQARCYVAADAYFAEMISYETGVDEEEVLQYFGKMGNHMLQNMVMSTESYIGGIYFYQNVLALGGKKYQVRIACSDWNIINFICTEYSTTDKREQAEWKAGKKKMIEVLEQSGVSLSRFFSYMSHLNDLGAPTIYYFNEEYENAYLVGLRYLEEVTSEMGIEVQMEPEVDPFLEIKMDMLIREWEGIYYGVQTDGYANEKEGDEKGDDFVDGKDEESEDTRETDQEVEYSVNYSYQVVELKDMILLLVQGDVTMGLYFDPISRRFCGYNFFNEY